MATHDGDRPEAVTLKKHKVLVPTPRLLFQFQQPAFLYSLIYLFIWNLCSSLGSKTRCEKLKLHADEHISNRPRTRYMYRVPFIFATLAMSFPIVLCLLFLGTTRAVHKEDYRVSGLESVVPDFALFEGESYAGYVPTTPEFEKEPDGAIFFWLFEPSHPIQDDTLVIWLNGGPGCSSFDGLLFEHGPIMLPHIQAGPTLPASTKYDKLSFNPYSWTNATRMLYLEQPVGTGFSYGPEPEDETDVASDFYNFLRNFRLIFPHLKDTRLFIFGESYAGQ